MKKLVTNPDLIIIGLTILLFVLVMSSCCGTYQTKSGKGLAPVCGKAKSYNR